MTAIGAIVTDSDIVFGWDTAAVAHQCHYLPSGPKVHPVSPGVAIAIAGRHRVNCEVRAWIDQRDKQAADTAISSIMGSLERHLNAEPARRSMTDADGDIEAEFLVATGGRLFVGFFDFAWLDVTEVGYYAIGDGTDLLFGSLATTAESGLDPVLRLTRALEAAERHRPAIRGPFGFAVVPRATPSGPGPRRYIDATDG